MESTSVFSSRPRRHSAFSLIEVTLACGIAAFGLVGILGVLPIALSASRQSIDEGRGAIIANTIFTAMRDVSYSSSSQPTFNNVYYLDKQYDPVTGIPVTGAPETLNLATLGLPAADGTKSTVAVICYAKFLAGPTDPIIPDDVLGSQRRFCLTSTPPTGGADYKVALYFDNKPFENRLFNNAKYDPLAAGQANRVEVVVSPISRPTDRYRFFTTICYRRH